MFFFSVGAESSYLLFRGRRATEAVYAPWMTAVPSDHGGAVAGFMEQAAIIFILLEMGEPKVPKTIDFTIDYLRAGLFRDTFAECRITRLGRRIANVHISAWQKRREEPITIARAHFLLSEENN